jgi:P27 family predicted phage terminase small subunit
LAGGRPTKPTALKILQGNPGKRPLPANEPLPPVGDVVPSWPLGESAQAAWDRLVPLLQGMRVLSLADVEKLTLGCDAIGEYLDLRGRIKKTGRVYTTVTVSGSTVYHPRPEIAMAADAWKKASAILGEFGLSPSARAKVQTIGEAEKDPFAEYMRGASG